MHRSRLDYSSPLICICLALLATAWAGHSLTIQQEKISSAWLAQHPGFRPAMDADCNCAEDIEKMKTGYGGKWIAQPTYHPYVATGDFNGDGVSDFAIVVIDTSKSEKNFVLLVFNGPFSAKGASPAFIKSGLDLRWQGLVFGPPRPKPYRLVVGSFESDNTAILVPRGRSYELQSSDRPRKETVQLIEKNTVTGLLA